MTDSAPIAYAARGDIGVVELDDGKANAMRSDWFVALHAALDRAEADEVRALVVRGRPGIFSGGLDLKFLPTLDASELPAFTRAFAETMLRVWAFPAPTVAEVTGHAIAGGCVLASACDARLGLAGPYRIQMNEHWIGIPLPSWMRAILASAWCAPSLERLVMLGEVHDPAAAERAGMLHDVADDPDALAQAVRAMAERLAPLDRAALATTKRRFRGAASERVLAELEAP
jgi:enoyl-CoA hydratase